MFESRGINLAIAICMGVIAASFFGSLISSPMIIPVAILLTSILYGIMSEMSPPKNIPDGNICPLCLGSGNDLNGVTASRWVRCSRCNGTRRISTPSMPQRTRTESQQATPEQRRPAERALGGNRQPMENPVLPLFSLKGKNPQEGGE